MHAISRYWMQCLKLDEMVVAMHPINRYREHCLMHFPLYLDVKVCIVQSNVFCIKCLLLFSDNTKKLHNNPTKNNGVLRRNIEV